MSHRRIYVPTKRRADGERNAYAKCQCGWTATWPKTQAAAADAYRTHLRAVGTPPRLARLPSTTEGE